MGDTKLLEEEEYLDSEDKESDWQWQRDVIKAKSSLGTAQRSESLLFTFSKRKLEMIV